LTMRGALKGRKNSLFVYEGVNACKGQSKLPHSIARGPGTTTMHH
jgi:hypothetical protein